MNEDLFKFYLQMTGGTEVPAIYRRWALIAGLGAWLGRDTYFKFGGSEIRPNLYVLLMGTSGARKTSAIRDIKKRLSELGYDSFAPEKITKEKYLMELAGIADGEQEDIFDQSWGSATSESFIAAEEFNDFFGNNIFDFTSTLGVLWDYSGVYKNKIKHGVQVEIDNPTISLLSANTPSTLADTFPPNKLGQGFFSRLVLVFSEPSKKRITFPAAPTEQEKEEFSNRMREIKAHCGGEISITPEAMDRIDRIYKSWSPVPDERFLSYSTRRLVQLLKLTVIHATARRSTVAEVQDAVYANTVLSYAEHFMPKAFGEFGRSKNAEVANKVVELLNSADRSLTFVEIWELVNHDLTGIEELANILKNLTQAGKVQSTKDGFLSKRRVLDLEKTDFLDFIGFLTKEELGYE